jgi:hypothetical protein
LKNQAVDFEERKMMGGLCFMVDDKMCFGLVFHKKKRQDLFMARIGLEKQKEWSGKRGCIPMDFTGKTMKNFVFIDPSGYDLEEDLLFWIQLCLDFNPLAKASKKRKL